MDPMGRPSSVINVSRVAESGPAHPLGELGSCLGRQAKGAPNRATYDFWNTRKLTKSTWAVTESDLIAFEANCVSKIPILANKDQFSIISTWRERDNCNLCIDIEAASSLAFMFKLSLPACFSHFHWMWVEILYTKVFSKNAQFLIVVFIKSGCMLVCSLIYYITKTYYTQKLLWTSSFLGVPLMHIYKFVDLTTPELRKNVV